MSDGINLDGPLFAPLPGEGGDVSQDWPVYGIEDVNDKFLRTLPFPVDIYRVKGDKTSGLVGRAEPANFMYPARYIPNDPTPAPHEGEYWDDDCACFVKSLVVWNGVAMGGVAEVLDEDGFIRRRRLYDGTLLGEWPAHPPRYSKPVNPEKARLAAEEEAA